MRSDFQHGRFELEVETSTFDLRQYNDFLSDNNDAIADFKQSQQQAFDEERERWIATGQATFEADPAVDGAMEGEEDTPDGCVAVPTHVPGNVWKVCVEGGQSVSKGDTIVVVESMKMEINIEATADGTIESLLCAEGSPVSNGQNLALIKES